MLHVRAAFLLRYFYIAAATSGMCLSVVMNMADIGLEEWMLFVTHDRMDRTVG